MGILPTKRLLLGKFQIETRGTLLCHGWKLDKLRLGHTGEMIKKK
jgi:hypothetical protein